MNPFQIIQMLMNSNNPEQMLMQILGDDPRYSKIMPMINNLKGKSKTEAEQYVRQCCKTHQKDIDPVLDFAKQFNLPL